MNMRVGFFLQGDNADYIRMAKLTIASVRKTMPGVEVWHLTDANTPMVEGADGAKRITEDMPMAVRRMTHNARLYGEWLLIDCDVIVQKDVRHVFDEPFDVALTDRIGTDMEGTRYGLAMPINLGVAFSRTPKFWELVLKHLRQLSPQLQHWTGDQLIVCELLKNGLASGFSVKMLPGLEFNYPPLAGVDPLTAQASIAHFKGARKARLLKEAA